MLIRLYYLYQNLKLRLQNWFYNEQEWSESESKLETIVEETERYDYNKYN